MRIDPTALLTLIRAPLVLAPKMKNAGARVRRRYDRDAAVAHARAHWDRYCCDGYCAVTTAPAYRKVVPGNQFNFPGNLGGLAAC